jgi:ribosomal protein L32
MSAELGPVCATGKRGFPSERAAKARLDSIRRSPRQTGKVPTRVYQCPMCGGWHLTNRKSGRAW